MAKKQISELTCGDIATIIPIALGWTGKYFTGKFFSWHINGKYHKLGEFYDPVNKWEDCGPLILRINPDTMSDYLHSNVFSDGDFRRVVCELFIQQYYGHEVDVEDVICQHKLQTQ